MTTLLFTPEHEQLLMTLLTIPTVSPMETGRPAGIAEAQRVYAEHSARLGMTTVLHEPATLSTLRDPSVPVSVREVAEQMGAAFLHAQPNLLLRLGPARSPTRTLMFNFHMDTVDGDVPTNYEGGRFTGRGAVDMKGPGVALLAGIGGALLEDPSLSDDLTILVQCVSGEEGGAMGVYGTRFLAEQGYFGRLNIFAEPSEGYFFDHSTTAMTARIRVEGQGSTDDEPQMGHNATLLLAFMAQELVRQCGARIDALGGKMCVAGLHTGHMHNRVYGTGTLLLNFAYPSLAVADAIRAEVEGAFAKACAQFQTHFRHIAIARPTAEALPQICSLNWLKEGLPVLNNRDDAMEQLLQTTGLCRSTEERRAHHFTCDAMWVQQPGIFTVVCGPGSLGDNGAHTDHEFIDLEDLEQYARSVARIITAFRGHLRSFANQGGIA